jgi:uncharacterized protein (TIGR02145 family)
MKVNNKYWLYTIIATGMIIMLASNCTKDDTKSNTVTDIDGNIYHTVTIGTQEWTVENMKTSKFNDGSSIPLVTNDTVWRKAKAAYCLYKNDASSFQATYGALYNWYVVDTACNGDKNVCPAGWHVPNETEWITLLDYLGGSMIAGGKLKETGTVHWMAPNTGADNSSGFTALPGGQRDNSGWFSGIGSFGSVGYWWSVSEEKDPDYDVYNPGCLYLNYDLNLAQFQYASGKETGFSVRCLKDN